MMINVNNFFPGITFKYKNNIYLLIKIKHSKSAREKAYIKTKVKNLRNNTIIKINFSNNEKVEKVIISNIEVQYLYKNNNSIIFMNIKNYEQLKILKNNLIWEKNFLKEGLIISIIKYNNEVLKINLPDKINLKVLQTEMAIKGNTSCKITKKAILETGLELQVPLFIKKNDIIVVLTNNGKYYKRV